ncbi:hypothetical protein [Hoeflea sp.]|uniref:hypothetical protein n=1 Tax=Hoeflea sp. TaxID=1940281 RepID=UPI0019A68715|nr:hypothetical protein [Hoeflea sp.]MBC7285098.1 hypothetical protein [Hoeflea sp.]
MIEFILLFALGFLAAALVALIVAPVIQRRVVTLTERRIRASVPLSVAEIRAEKDMARAAFAAENARLSVDLKHNRDLLTDSVARGTRLSNELVAIRAAKLSAEQAIEERDASIRELGAELSERDNRITTLTGHFNDATRLAEARNRELAKRDDRINRLGAEIEELRIDLVTLDTEAENFKAQIRELRDERTALRETLKVTETANRDLELRLKNHDDRLAQTEEKLAATITALSDRENALDRRVAEIERFRQKNKELAEELRAAKSALKGAGSMKTDEPEAAANQPRKPKAGLRVVYSLAEEEPPAADGMTDGDAVDPASLPPIEAEAETATPETAAPDEASHAADHEAGITEDEKIDRLRARQAALVERLLKADKNKNDAALRREIATVAAMMVELTARRDGKSSKIHTILKGVEKTTLPGSSDPSLAARAGDLLAASN